MLQIVKIFLLFPALLLTATFADGQTPEQEADLKAVFLYNFTKYVEWNNSQDENEFVIGILGTSDIARSIDEIARTNTVNNKRITIKRFSKLEDIGHCHILFIPKECPYPLSSVLDKLDKGVLTISEEPGLGRMGTAFNFVLLNDKLKFEANLKAISTAGVKVSAQLLKLAIIIN